MSGTDEKKDDYKADPNLKSETAWADVESDSEDEKINSATGGKFLKDEDIWHHKEKKSKKPKEKRNQTYIGRNTEMGKPTYNRQQRPWQEHNQNNNRDQQRNRQLVQTQPQPIVPNPPQRWSQDGAKQMTQINVEVDIDEQKPFVSTVKLEVDMNKENQNFEELKTRMKEYGESKLFKRDEMLDELANFRLNIDNSSVERVLKELYHTMPELQDMVENNLVFCNANDHEDVGLFPAEFEKCRTVTELVVLFLMLCKGKTELTTMNDHIIKESILAYLGWARASIKAWKTDVPLGDEQIESKMIVKYMVRIVVLKMLSEVTGCEIMKKGDTSVLILAGRYGVRPFLALKIWAKLAEAKLGLMMQGVSAVRVFVSNDRGIRFKPVTMRFENPRVFFSGRVNATYVAKQSMLAMLNMREGFIPCVDIMYSEDGGPMQRIKQRMTIAIIAELTQSMQGKLKGYELEEKREGDGFVFKKIVNGFSTHIYNYRELLDILQDKKVFATIAFHLAKTFKEMLYEKKDIKVSMWSYCSDTIFKPSNVTLTVHPVNETKMQTAFDYDDEIKKLTEKYGDL